MAIVICTKRCFLLCDNIINVTLDEWADRDDDDNDDRLTVSACVRRWIQRIREADTLAARDYRIEIDYTRSNQHGEQQDQTYVRVRGYKEACALFKEIVHEIREQKPDQAYLDNIVAKMLSTSPDDK